MKYATKNIAVKTMEVMEGCDGAQTILEKKRNCAGRSRPDHCSGYTYRSSPIRFIDFDDLQIKNVLTAMMR